MPRWLAALLVYVLLTPVMVSPVTHLTRLGASTYGGDALWATWTLGWNNHVVLDGASSYFDANIFYPARRTLARNEHLFGLALVTLPVFAATRNALLAYDVVWLASFPLCGLAAFGLASLVARGFLPRLLAGLVYAFAFWRYARVMHIQYLWTFGLPLTLWIMHRWWLVQRRGQLAAWVAVMLLQTLTSWYFAVLCLLSNVLWQCWLAVSRRPADRAGAPGGTTVTVDWLRTLVLLGTAWAVILAVLWWFARPYFALPPGHPEEALIHAAGWRTYLAPPRATLTGQWLLDWGVQLPPWSFETTNFLGFIPLALSIVGLVGSRRLERESQQSVVAFFVALALVAAVLSLGPSAAAVRSGGFDWMPFGLLAQLPGMQAFRAPARFALLVVLSVAVLAAAGGEVLLRFRYGRLVLLIALPLVLLETRPLAYDLGRPHEVRIPRVYVLLHDLPPGPVLSLPAFPVPPTNWFDADYMLYSTVHWKPIMNGYSRTTPPGHVARMQSVAAFPAPEALALLRKLGVRYVVTHARRYGVDLRPAVETALRSPDVELLARDGEDYLWRVK